MEFRERSLEDNAPEPGEEDPGEALPDEVGIGWFGPFGKASPEHAGMWWAVSQAVDEANAGGGYRGRPFRLLPCWSENPWGTGVRQLAHLVYRERPWALLGSVDSPGTHLAEQIVAKARLSLVSPVSTDSSVNLAGVPWMFSCAPGDDQLANLVAGHLAAAFPDPGQHCVLFSATDHDSRMATRALVRALAKHKRSPQFRFDTDPGAGSDLQVHLDALRQADPDVVIISAGAAHAARLVKALRQARFKGTVIGTAPLGRRHFLQQAGPAAEGVRFPLLFMPDAGDAATRGFIQAFKARFGAEPDYAEVFTYDAAALLLQAIRSTSLDRAAIRNALVRGAPWPGLSGPVTWDGTGRNTRAVTRMGLVTGGAVEVLESAGTP